MYTSEALLICGKFLFMWLLNKVHWKPASQGKHRNFKKRSVCALEGEPFNNYDAVMSAIRIATHPMGLHFSKNKVTVSTVGLVPQIKRFCRSSMPAQLAVSLHATNDALRNEIVPINRTHSLAHLTNALRCAL
jgi:adenine C2-methylase RlmN of 23S rRNA A2503 and tRNA A37